MNAGRVVREARRRSGLTQRGLAELVHMPQSAIARIERGQVTPKVDTLERLLDACGEGLYAMPRSGVGVDRTQIVELLRTPVSDRVWIGDENARDLYEFREAVTGRVAETTPTRRAEVVRLLAHHEVRYVAIGGLAANARGAPYVSYDVDICFQRDAENFERLASALADVHTRLRGAPEDLPSVIDARFLANGDHFTFATDLGDIDCMMTPAGIEGGYEELERNATTEVVAGMDVRVAGLEDLIRMKIALSRPKDRYHLEFLRALQEEIDEAERKRREPR